MNWTIKEFRGAERVYRQATPEEIKALRNLGGARHVTYGCRCGHGHWSSKNLALGENGGYFPIRSIFYLGEGPECKCKSSELVCIVPVS